MVTATTPGNLAPDLNCVRESLRLLVDPGQVFEIRAFVLDRGREVIYFGYFDEIDAAIGEVSRLSRSAIGIYCTLNPIVQACLARARNRCKESKKRDTTTGDKHIIRRTRMLLDFDGTPVTGVSSSNEEHQRAIDLALRVDAELRAEGWPYPLIGDSGNGAHLDYTIDEPADDGDLVKRVLEAANHRWGGNGIKIDEVNFNPARIVKLYGTPTRKGDNAPDRPWRVSRLIEAPDKLDPVPHELLERLAKTAPTASTTSKSTSTANKEAASKKQRGKGWTADQVREFMAKHGIETRSENTSYVHRSGKHGTLWVLSVCPHDSEHSRGEVHVHVLDDGTPGFGCKHDGCKGKGWKDFVEHYDPEFYKKRRKPVRINEDLPRIDVTVNMTEVVDQAEAALLKRGGIYVRGMKLAHVIRDWSAPPRFELKTPEGLPVIATLAEVTLREQMSSVAQWWKYDARAEEDRPTIPPEWVAKTLSARKEWPDCPVLDGISDTPVLRHDGSIHDVKGYDERTRWIYAPSTEWPAIKRDLKQKDAREAYKTLADPFQDMLYVSGRGVGCDLAATMSLILSVVGRAAIHGPVPAHVAMANTPGSAKTLVIDTCAIIATGREASKMPVSHDDAELRKRMTPIALAGLPIMSIDNVEGVFGSESLAMVLTSNTWRDRVLGKSEDCGDLPFRTVLCFNGNGIQLVGDLGRRSLPIRFDPGCEHPEDRKDFEYGDLKGHVTEHREELYIAALTMLAAWLRSDEYRQRKPGGKGSFEAWDAIVRGAILWAGGADVNEGMEALRSGGDHDLERLRTLVAELRRNSSLQDSTASDILDAAKSNPNLQTAIDAYQIKNEPVNTKRLGAVFAKYTGRVVKVTYKESTGALVTKLFRIAKGDTAGGGVARWGIEEVTPKGAPE